MRYTPREQINPILNEKIGEVARSNCFATFRGRLLYIKDERCFFEILENVEYPQYNCCAGKIEYLPESMVMCLNFEK
jgi:hypothetical protein